MNRIMQKIIIIAAVASGGALGRNGDLLFHISADLRRFKELTLGHPIIMGRKTFESFPTRPLPGRRNIVVTRNSGYRREGIETASSLEEAIALAGEDCFVIGGGEIYRQALPLATSLQLTEIAAECPDADTFFPEVSADQWRLTWRGGVQTDPATGVEYTFAEYTRI